MFTKDFSQLMRHRFGSISGVDITGHGLLYLLSKNLNSELSELMRNLG